MNDLTKLLHFDQRSAGPHGELHSPVYRNIAYHYEKSTDIEQVFQGKRKGYSYGRQGNPTTAALEKKITLLEQGVDTVAFATGMGAISAMLFALLRAGDHVVASSYLFGNTRSLFESFERFGVKVEFTDTTDVSNVERLLTPQTRMVYVETIANPRTQVSDLARIGELCANRATLYVVDNTMTSPALFKPRGVGASLVVNSLSKYMAGHGVCLGGSVTDTGLFDWSRFSNILETYRSVSSSEWGMLQIRKKGLRDMGATLSPDSANLIALGLESLEMRMERISSNALQLAAFLEGHKLVEKVYYPGSTNHPQYERATTLFSACSGLMSFETARAVDVNRFIDGLECFACSSNLGDTRSLLIPVATTIFYELSATRRREMDISERLIRLSVGIEPLDDLLQDLDRALQAAAN
jgi:O-acetylhomoserine (thiol)-lyase